MSTHFTDQVVWITGASPFSGRYQAAKQILRALAKGKFEAYIGKPGKEKLGLLLNRFAPGMLIRRAPGLGPA